MSEMGEAIFKSKKALPNKLMQEDGSITDMLGNPVTNSVVEYDSKTSLPNKWMNPDGSYSTLNEIIAGAIDTDLFIVVQELPETGESNKIYLVPKDGGTGFVEWIYADGQWDTIGELEIDLSNYPTINDMQQYVGSNTLTKTNTTEFTPTANYHPATKKYVDDKSAIQVFYWDGTTGSSANVVEFWDNIYKLQKRIPVIVVSHLNNSMTKLVVYYLYNMTPSSGSIYLHSSQLSPQYSVLPVIKDNPGNISNSTIKIHQHSLVITINRDTDVVSSVILNTDSVSETKLLETNVNYGVPYTPQYPGSPATKKYVDDAIATNVTTMLNGNY